LAITKKIGKGAFLKITGGRWGEPFLSKNERCRGEWGSGKRRDGVKIG